MALASVHTQGLNDRYLGKRTLFGTGDERVDCEPIALIYCRRGSRGRARTPYQLCLHNSPNDGVVACGERG